MLAVDTGTASILVAVIGVVGAVIVAMIQATRREVRAVNKAVNNVPDGTPPLVDRVANVERRVDSHSRWVGDSLELIGTQLGVRLPDRREYDHYPQEVRT